MDRVTVVFGIRRVIDRVNGQTDGGNVAAVNTVGGTVSKAVHAVVVGLRRVEEAAIRVQAE
jgi:hypothetical protein